MFEIQPLDPDQVEITIRMPGDVLTTPVIEALHLMSRRSACSIHATWEDGRLVYELRPVSPDPTAPAAMPEISAGALAGHPNVIPITSKRATRGERFCPPRVA